MKHEVEELRSKKDGLESLMDLVSDYEHKAIWNVVAAKDLTVAVIPDAPLFMNDYMNKGLQIPEISFGAAPTYQNAIPSASEDSLRSTMDSTRLALYQPDSSLYPIATTALSSVVATMGGGDSPVLLATCDSRKVSRANEAYVAMCLNFMRRNVKGNCKVLTFLEDDDEKVDYVAGPNYHTLEFSGLLNAANEAWNNLSISPEFEYGVMSRKLFSVVFKLADSALTLAISDAMLRAGKKLDGEPAVKIVSSNVGISGANIFPMILGFNGCEMPLGSPIKMFHNNNDASYDTFKKNMEKTFALFKQVPGLIDKLGSTTIYHAADCIMNIADDYSFPKILYDAAVEAEKSGLCVTALDCYQVISDTVSEYWAEKKLDSVRINNLMQQVAQVLYADWKDFDRIRSTKSIQLVATSSSN